MTIKDVLRSTGLSLDQLSELLSSASKEPDLAQLRKNAGFVTQGDIVDAIKKKFADEGIEERTMTVKSWSEYERGVRVPQLSLKGWMVLCSVLECTPQELIKAIDKSTNGDLGQEN